MSYPNTTFPTTIDVPTNPTAGDDTSTFDHAGLHIFENNAIAGLEAKVGADGSAVTTSHDYKLSGVTGSDKAVSKTGSETLTNKTLTAPTIATITNGGTVTIPSGTVTLATTVDSRFPSSSEKSALVGNNIDIAVGSGNKYVTQTGLQYNAEKYAADAGSNDTYVITLSPVPTSYTNGMVVYFKANTANTGVATLNVNSLGAKTIVKGVNTTLEDGDIAAGMFCTVIYDSTNFVLQNPVITAITPQAKSTSGVSAGAATSSTQTITHGLGKTPSIIRLFSAGYMTGGVLSGNPGVSYGTYNSTGNRCVYITATWGSGSNSGGSSAPSQSTTNAIYLTEFDGSSSVKSAAGVVGNLTSTTFDIVWTLSGATLANSQFIWEAQ